MATVAAGYEPQPLFDPISRVPYALAGFIILATVALFEITGFSVAPWLIPWPLLVFFIVGPLCRRIGKPRLAGALECFGFLYGEAIFVFTLLPLTALSGSLADNRLAAWDRALGFNWVAFVTWAKPGVPVFKLAYDSFALQALFLVSLLFYTGNGLRAWRLASAALLALIACSAAYPFFPADSAMMHYGVYPIDFPAVLSGPTIAEVKGGLRHITEIAQLKGLITFPSYHACAAALLAWAAWPLRGWRWAFLALNIIMAISCLVVGSHYLVDVIGGVAITGAALFTVERLVRPTASSRFDIRYSTTPTQ